MRWRLIAVLVGFTAIVLLVQNIPLAQYLRTVEYDRSVTGLQRDAFAIARLAVESLEAEAGALTDAVHRGLVTAPGRSAPGGRPAAGRPANGTAARPAQSAGR